MRGIVLKKKNAISALIVALGLAGFNAVEGADLRWPLDIEISQSSSFAEFRGMRFHAGLDLRTKQSNGFPVYAIEDGFISRASVQFTGYGYGLYIDHPKLNARVVYGHLQKFNGPIQEYVAGKLKAKGSRHGFQEFFKADRFPVKKGQIVAYSGESGAGPSHLHFEMRNFNDDPIAPCKFGYRPKDNIYPTLYHFYVEPMEYCAVVDGSFKGQKYPLIKRTKELYGVNVTPVTCGKVACQLGISDTNGFGNKYGIETINFSLNGQKLIQRDFYQYSYDTNRQCPWVYDYFKSNANGTGYVINLFKYPFETLPIAAAYPAWSGVMDNSSYQGNSASYEIIASDYGHNKVTINGDLAKTSFDFTKAVPSEDLAAKYLLYEIAPQTFETVVTCKNPNFESKTATAADMTKKAGCTEIRDANGNMHRVPCLYNAKWLELAFKNEKCWEGGAWLGKVQLLPKTFCIEPAGGRITENGISVEFKKNTVHFPILAMLRNIKDRPEAGGNNREGFLTPFSAVWRFDPDEMVFDAEAVIRMTPREFHGDINKLGVYYVDNKFNYSHNGEEVENGCLKFTTRAGGRYVILEDKVAPTFTYARHFKHYQLGNVYAFKGKDLGKGISWLSGSATINGTKVETYADPDKKEIYVIIPSNLKLPHKVKLSAKDYADNWGSITTTISK